LVQVYHASGVRELRFLRSRLRFGRRRLASYLREGPVVLFSWLAARSATRILVLSEFTRSVFVSEHGAEADRVVRVSGGVDVELFTPADGVAAARARLGIADAETLLLTVRRLVPRMGLEELLRAFALLPPENLRLAVVGTGALEGDLRLLSRQLCVDDRVLFLGSVGEEELRDWYRAPDLFVLPTLADEGFGMVTAEALASGTPVVGTPVGATPELLEPLDPRLVAGGSDASSLAAAIRRGLALATDELRGRCRDYACAQLSWEHSILAWEAAISEAVAASDKLDRV
jgi:glycosyltransferase involved in cell wall biosynthesis